MIFYSTHYILTLIYTEALLRFSAYGQLNFSLPWLFFLILSGLVLGLIVSVFKGKAASAVSVVLNIFIFFFYAVHLIYQHTFKSFLSISQLAMGGDALSTYGHETFLSAMEVKWYLLGMIVPAAAAIFFGKKYKVKQQKLKSVIISVLVIAVIHVGAVLSLPLFGTGTYTHDDIYNDTFVLSLSEKLFGTLTSARLEIRGLFFGSGQGGILIDDPSAEPNIPPETAFDPNSFVDFDALEGKEFSEAVSNLNKYFASRTPTYQNEYTGMFRDYNIIYMACESFSPYLLDAERTPVLYKMANEGFVFNNYYSTINDNTSNSEFVYLTGLLPDSSLLGKGWKAFYDFNSFTASKKNYLPFTVGNQMKSEGARSTGVHYYYGTYYGRKDTHPNLGMDFYYMTHGMPYTEDWPTSDLDMLKHSLDQYVLKRDENGIIPRFAAYYLTFSGHMYYKFDSNRIARINKSVSDGLPYSETTRAYVSCNYELEKAVEYLMEELKAAGVYEKTLFVMIPDHYPYTLGLERLSELAGKDLQADAFESEFNQYKGCLLMWSPSMTEPVSVDKVCCELDILPTISNLMGFKYDSRLLLGNDIFSSAEGVAVLGDRSFVTKDFAFDANSAAVYSLNGKEPDQAELERINTSVKNKFTVSTEMIYNDYYRQILQ